MKFIYLLSLLIFSGMFGFSQTSIPDQPIQTAPANNEMVNSDTNQVQPTRVDTVVIEKVRVDTVFVPAPAVPDPVQEQPKTQNTNKTTPKAKNKNDKVYYGGYASFSFGNYSRIGIEPLIAYKLLPKFSVGAKLSYEYFKNKNYSPSIEGSNYGISAFSRIRIKKKLYAHVEFTEMNYKLFNTNGESSREWISFLYLGGGFSQRITKKSSFNVEVLWDVLQNESSPYKAGEPIVNVGVGIGF